MDDSEIVTEDEFDAELDYWVQQGLVECIDGLYKPTESGWEDPVVSLVFHTVVADELTALMEAGLIEAYWDAEQNDMVFSLTEKGRGYIDEDV